jgi:nitrous oxidase accessory protein
LVAAVRKEPAGSTITIAPGTCVLDAPLEPKAGMSLEGAGMDKTVITHIPNWQPSTEKLPDSEIDMKWIDTYAYLVRLQDKAADVTISNRALRDPQLHGAIFGARNENLHLHHPR